jgi:cell division protein FtsB
MTLTIRIAGNWLYRMRRILATALVALLTLFAGYKVVFGANGLKVYDAKRVENQKLLQEIEQEKSKNEHLLDKVHQLQEGDARAVEKAARVQGFVKPGEIVLVEPQPKPDYKTPSVAESQTPPPVK